LATEVAVLVDRIFIFATLEKRCWLYGSRIITANVDEKNGKLLIIYRKIGIGENYESFCLVFIKNHGLGTFSVRSAFYRGRAIVKQARQRL